MDILLHLGAHRCATTTFQSYLWDNRTRLAKRGLTCWTPKRTRDGLLNGLVRHPALITLKDERKGIRSIGRLRIEMARLQLNGQQGLLISEENILGSIRNNIADTRLYPLLRERLMRFLPAFEGHKLTIGLSVRSYEDYWRSCLTQMVMRGQTLPSSDLLDFLTTQPRRWRHLIRDIADVFPEADIVVWPFERMADKPDAQLRAVWPNDTGPLDTRQIWRNRSVDLVGLNSVLAMRGERVVEEGFVEVGKRWMPFDEDQCSVLRAEYRRDLAWLKGGADGLAQYKDGAHGPIHDPNDGVHVLAHGIGQSHDDGRLTPASRPDRCDRTRAVNAVFFGGRHDRIEKGQFGNKLG